MTCDPYFYLVILFTGFSSVSGGNSLSAYYLYLYYNAAGTASEFQDSQLTIRSEAGFSCFVYLSGFILCTAAALYISPLIASKKEARGLKQPQTLEELYPGERPVVTSPGIPVRNV